MRFRNLVTTICFLAVGLMAFTTGADDDLQLTLPQQFDVGGGFDLPGGNQDDPVTFSGSYVVSANGKQGRLSIQADIAEHWHIYSLTQKPGGPVKSTLTLPDSSNIRLTGEFTPNKDPHIKPADIFPVPSEEFTGTVIFTAPFEILPGADPTKLTIQPTFEGQACEDQEGGFGKCIPLGPLVVEVGYEGVAEEPTAGPYRDPAAHVELVGLVTPSTVQPGDTIRIEITATPDTPYHIYDYDVQPSDAYSKTLIAMTKTNSWSFTRATTSAATEQGTDTSGHKVLYHEQPVTWTVEVRVPKDAAEGEYTLGGMMGYQTCTDSKCDRPAGASFTATVQVGPPTETSTVALTFGKSSYREAKQASKLSFAQMDQNLSLLSVIGFSLLGGLILNLMPCVLPVIGLKLMSFAEQGGESRGRIFALNLWYAIGLISVFLVLATLSAFLNMGWGEQFTYTWFKVTMIAVVFAMALSFLGTWEIPIPGFAGTGQANKLQEKEGYAGAFFKGIFTTILATPCSGPFLGPVFGYTLSQPAYVTYVIFGCVGLGMASPYLVVGLAPSLVKLLPRPGAWMETFKQAMAFVLLGTVVYLFTTINGGYFVATLALLVAIWLACWWIGRTPFTASFPRKAMTWITGVAIASVLGYFAFHYLTPHEKLLPWKPYSPDALAAARAEGKTVMIDFTADWCLTCQANSRFAIETPKVLGVVEENDVVTLLADWTDHSATIKAKLNELGKDSIPMLAVYPAGSDDPIVLPDLLKEANVVDALELAGPSQTSDTAQGSDTAQQDVSTAMR